MLENISDRITLIVLVTAVIYGIYMMWVISDRHHNEKMKQRESQYFALLENMEDDYDDSENEAYID